MTSLKQIRKVLKSARDLVRFAVGVGHYWLRGATTDRAYQAMIQLFCSTGGVSNDLATRVIGLFSPKRALPSQSGVLGCMTGIDLSNAMLQLRRDGYLLFPAALPPAACDQLMQFAKATPSVRRRMDGEAAEQEVQKVRFDLAEIDAVRYDYETQALLDNYEVQELLADGSILTLAQEYLGSTPKADILSMWWHTNFHQQPDSEAAQYYHFDMDRIKWLKLFIYVTDVGPNDGPHSFIAGSHRTGGIPADLLKKGYARLTDDEVKNHFPVEREISFTAPRGSIIVEDTRGLHKGKPVAVVGCSRLVLQLQFSNSLFGAVTPKAKLRSVCSASLRSAMDSCPEIYRQYL